MRNTAWKVINIKARKEQTPEHYINAMEKLKIEDPLVDTERSGRSMSLKSLSFAELKDPQNQPCWINISLLQYVIVDPKGFYNKRTMEDFNMDWNSDIVANKKEEDMYFIPSVHRLVIRNTSDISTKNILLKQEPRVRFFYF